MDTLRQPLLPFQSDDATSSGNASSELRLPYSEAEAPAGCADAVRPSTIPWVPSLTVSWITPVVRTASVRQLQERDLPLLPEDMRPGPCGARLWELWLQQQSSLAQPGSHEEPGVGPQDSLARGSGKAQSRGEHNAEQQGTGDLKKGKKGPSPADAPSLYWPLLQAFGWEYVWAGFFLRVSRARARPHALSSR